MQSRRYFTKQKESTALNSGTTSWSHEAMNEMSAGFCSSVPTEMKVVEENTLPSWLWRHQGADGCTQIAETNIEQIFSRIAGSATYLGWKRELFLNENAARSFYDEVFYLLTQRVIALDPDAIASLGSDWAYGLRPLAINTVTTTARAKLSISNQTIDAILSGSDNGAQQRWLQFLDYNAGQNLSLNFHDTVREWGAAPAVQMPRLLIDLLQFLRNDGTCDIEGIQHTVRLATILLDLHYEQLVTIPENSRALQIGFCNLAPLLMMQGLAYNSDAARSTAAALSAIITAVATKTSAELAQLLGDCPAFVSDRQAPLRVISNRRRAAYGETTDYDHVSVLPQPLLLESCPDLALVAAARRLWDEAQIAAQRYGLRHIQLTGFFNNPALMAIMESSASGIRPEVNLQHEQQIGEDHFVRSVNPALPFALLNLNYDPTEVKSLLDYVMGHLTLQGAPCINHVTLFERGLSQEKIQQIEEYLRQTSHLQLAITPWLLGVDYCQQALKIPAEKINNMSFDLLEQLGFSAAEIQTANRFCYGHGTLENSTALKPEHREVFCTAGQIPASAMIEMAAAVQSFITGDVGLTLIQPAETTIANRSQLLLSAWQLGLKNVNLYLEFSNNKNAQIKSAKQQRQEASQTQPKLRSRKRPAPLIPQPPATITKTSKTVIAKAAEPKATNRAVSLRKKGENTRNKTVNR